MNLCTPPRSKVTPDELYEEVGQYFDLGLEEIDVEGPELEVLRGIASCSVAGSA
jgi:hypothetical protein